MTPAYLNSPPSHSSSTFLEVKDGDFQLFLSPQPQAISSSLSHHHHQDQKVVLTKPDEGYSKPLDHKVYDNFMTHEGSSDHQQASSSSSVQSTALNRVEANGGRTLSFSTKYDSWSANENNGSSAKWMSSKMRIMRKMMETNSGGEEADDNNISKPVRFTGKFGSPVCDSDETNCFSKTAMTIRVCSDCNTTTTPLWRSGPRGPKSLCNACGIRQRKARRAMEAAAAANGGAAVATDASAMKIKGQMNKEKKSRASHVGQNKKQYSPPNVQSRKRLCSFKDFALSLSQNSALQSVFPQDVEDAAILLMELSCGLVHS